MSCVIAVVLSALQGLAGQLRDRGLEGVDYTHTHPHTWANKYKRPGQTSHSLVTLQAPQRVAKQQEPRAGVVEYLRCTHSCDC
jgi:hypothetical protein